MPQDIPFYRPHFTKDTFAKVNEVLTSAWITTGPYTKKFETQFAEYVKAKHAVMLNSGTAALHLGLLALGIEPGDEVITTPYTFASTLEVIEYIGAKPVLIDINYDDFNINAKLIEKKITKKTKAIIPVHFAGQPCEMNLIIKLAKKYKFYIIEDAAHCTPAYYYGKPIGSFAHVSCFSFYANKCITTGEGGMLTTPIKSVADKVRKLRIHGLSKDAINRYQNKGAWAYNIDVLGYKYNPTDVAAAMGISQLAIADKLLKMRTDAATYYSKKLKSLSTVNIPEVKAGLVSSWHLYPLRVKPEFGKYRNALIDYLMDQGIKCSMHFIPIHYHTYYINKYHYQKKDFPIATLCADTEISLPLFPDITKKQIDAICKGIFDFFDSKVSLT